MNDPMLEFLQTSSRRGSKPMLGNITAAIRFDITRDRQTSSWQLAVDNRRFAVSPEAAAAPADGNAGSAMNRVRDLRRWHRRG
jgi:hypothetical protein